MADHATNPETRKLKPIYDAIDTGSYKLAVQTCNKLLKKQPQHETIRALKSLALQRSNKPEEALQICDDLIASKPTDETVLNILTHVLKTFERTPDIPTMYEDAYKKQPGNEELAVQAFMAMIRVGLWKNAQVIALKIHKSFKNARYLYWSIMAALLQAQNAGGLNPGFSDHTPMLLALALRLIQSSPIPSHISPDHFWLHLTILKSLDKIDDAFEMITSPPGKKLCETSLLVEELRREIFLIKGANGQEAILCSERLKKGDRNWITFTSFIDATFRLMAQAAQQPAPDSAVNGTKIKPDSLSPPSTDAGAGEADPELTPRASPRLADSGSLEGPLKPEELLAGMKDLLHQLTQKDGLSDRGVPLAELYVERKVRFGAEVGGDPLPSGLLSLICQYFSAFSDKACCFEDLKPYVSLLSSLSDQSEATPEMQKWHDFLEGQLPSSRGTLADVQRTINVFKLQRFVISPQPTEAELTVATKYLRAYFDALPVGEDLTEKDIQPADDLALLAVNALVSAWASTKSQTHLHQALVVLECASRRSKHNYQIRFLAARIYQLLGANALALAHYHFFDIKLVQCDTLCHIILSRASTFSLGSIGDLGMIQECIGANEIYTQNMNDTPDMLVKAFQNEKYSQITEFVEFEDRLDNSLQRDLTRIDFVRMRFFTEKLDPEAMFQELIELEMILEKMHHDNRDFSVIPNYQPKGQQLVDQTKMGVTRGFQWLTVFLQLYIRAYARACKVDSVVSMDLSTFRTSWLSEMTEEEVEFLKFSQVLYDWVPCPPLEPREAIIDAAEGSHGNNNGDASAGIPAEKRSPPHVSLDGAPLEVDATKAAAIQYFAGALERCKCALTEAKPLWEALHIASLAQEAFYLTQIMALPWTSTPSKGKKAADPGFMQSLKGLRTSAAGHLREISVVLAAYSEAENTAERRKEFIAGCKILDGVNESLDHDFYLDVGSSLLEARKVICVGVAKGIPKVVEGF